MTPVIDTHGHRLVPKDAAVAASAGCGGRTRYAVEELGLAGISVSTSVNGLELADRRQDPISGKPRPGWARWSSSTRGAARFPAPGWRPSSYLRRIWFDSLVYTPAALRHLVEAVGADRVVLGTDYPFDMGVNDPVERAAAAGLPAADLFAIVSGNAGALFGIGADHRA